MIKDDNSFEEKFDRAKLANVRRKFEELCCETSKLLICWLCIFYGMINLYNCFIGSMLNKAEKLESGSIRLISYMKLGRYRIFSCRKCHPSHYMNKHGKCT